MAEPLVGPVAEVGKIAKIPDERCKVLLFDNGCLVDLGLVQPAPGLAAVPCASGSSKDPSKVSRCKSRWKVLGLRTPGTSAEFAPKSIARLMRPESISISMGTRRNCQVRMT